MDRPEPSFLLDSMLGRLAKWLVMLGYDARFAGAGSRPDLDLAEEALLQGRVLVTRDTRIPEIKGLRKLVLREQRLEEQLARVLREFGLKPDRSRLFTRCTVCNVPLERISREEALPLVPPLVRELTTDFLRCPGCARLYWWGTHIENTLKKLEGMGI